MSQKLVSSIQKYVFIGYLFSVVMFALAGFFLEVADAVVFFYYFSASLCLALLLLTLLALCFYFVNIGIVKKSDDPKVVDKRSFRFVAYSLLRFAISFLLFAFAMVVKMLAFGQFFSK